MQHTWRVLPIRLRPPGRLDAPDGAGRRKGVLCSKQAQANLVQEPTWRIPVGTQMPLPYWSVCRVGWGGERLGGLGLQGEWQEAQGGVSLLGQVAGCGTTAACNEGTGLS